MVYIFIYIYEYMLIWECCYNFFILFIVWICVYDKYMEVNLGVYLLVYVVNKYLIDLIGI